MSVGGALISASALGSAGFRADYGIRYAYVAGAMYKAVASVDLVVAMGRAGLIGYFGSGGLAFSELEAALRQIQEQLGNGPSFGMNLLCNLERPEVEARTVELYLKERVRFVEAAAFMQVTPSLVRYRLTGVRVRPDGAIEAPNRVLAKISRPEVALAFMKPAPESLLRRLVERGELTEAEANLAHAVPVAQEVCVEADSGGHTDRGVAFALLPAILALRAEVMAQHACAMPIRIGAAGGIGTPQAAAAAFILGADFVLTGSINQCTREAGTSDAVKDMLQEMSVQDTAYAPAGDMFELGSKVQVLKRGTLFPARANHLYELYQRHESLDGIDDKTRRQLESRYFRRPLTEIWQEARAHRHATGRSTDELERNEKKRMAAVFKWYFAESTRLALHGEADRASDYQIHCGPALGAFNQLVKGTPFESWRNRGVAAIGEQIMQQTAGLLTARFASFTNGTAAGRD